MDEIGRILFLIDDSLSTEKRCHIAGGILISISLLFCGLALTVLSVKPDSDGENNYDDYGLIYSETKGD